MSVLLARVADAGRIAPEERNFAGSAGGAFFITGGLTMALAAEVGGLVDANRPLLLLLSTAAVLIGASAIFLVRWDLLPAWLIHTSAVGSIVLIATAVAASGGSRSPAWIYLYFVVVFACYFYSGPVAGAYIAGCVVTAMAPAVYDSGSLHTTFAATLVIGVSGAISLGATMLAGKSLLRRLRHRAENLASEQAALRRVATAVVDGESSGRFYERVAREAAQLLGAGAAGVLQLSGPSEATVMGAWSLLPGQHYEPGTIVPVRPGSDVEEALLTGRPVRINRHENGSPVERLGFRCSIVAPVRVYGGVWGVLAVAADNAGTLSRNAEERLTTFSNLLSTAISNIDDRERLAAQASTDPLTALTNHRTLQERLSEEVARSARHGRTLSVALIDIDNFKHVNDVGGHEMGDQVLVSVADCLRRAARMEDTLGRLGGDEFAWVLPETNRAQALVALERARLEIAERVGGQHKVTISVGICDTDATADPAQLLQLADGALYWSKVHGRNQCWIYDPDVVSELSAQERAEHLERSQALLGLRALARAIDAKDAMTSQHSERVAELAARLANASGWPSERVMLLSEAALVHDVGKIGVPDAVLLKHGSLSAAEYEQIKQHAELGARIVDDVLTPEQVEWIRKHHERPDGRGYPEGVDHAAIPEGAALLAIADSWDAMIGTRNYSQPKSLDDALAECKRLVGAQFTQDALNALLRLHAEGGLGYPQATAPPRLVAVPSPARVA